MTHAVYEIWIPIHGFLHQLCSMIKPFFKICVSYIAIYHMYDWPWLQGHRCTPSRACSSSPQSGTPARIHSCGPSSMCVEPDYIKIDSVTDAAIWIVVSSEIPRIEYVSQMMCISLGLLHRKQDTTAHHNFCIWCSLHLNWTTHELVIHCLF